MNKLQSQTSSCPSSVSQAAAAAALNGDPSFVRDSVEVYRKRRDVAVEGLDAIEGLSVAPAEGASTHVNCSGVVGRTAPDGTVIENGRTHDVPPQRGRGRRHPGLGVWPWPLLRISFATSLETVNAGVDSIHKAVSALN